MIVTILGCHESDVAMSRKSDLTARIEVSCVFTANVSYQTPKDIALQAVRGCMGFRGSSVSSTLR